MTRLAGPAAACSPEPRGPGGPDGAGPVGNAGGLLRG